MTVHYGCTVTRPHDVSTKTLSTRPNYATRSSVSVTASWTRFTTPGQEKLHETARIWIWHESNQSLKQRSASPHSWMTATLPSWLTMGFTLWWIPLSQRLLMSWKRLLGRYRNGSTWWKALSCGEAQMRWINGNTGGQTNQRNTIKNSGSWLNQ